VIARPVRRRLNRGVLAAALSFLTIAASVVVGTSAAHAVACNNYSSSTSTCTNTNITIGGTSYSTDWYQPNGTATALMLMEHGFARGCGNLRNSAKAIAEQGVMVFCVNADMTGGNAALGTALGDALNARTIVPPNSKPLPVKYIVGGHSAGGHFASVVGARLNADGYANLKGAILFDAVASGGFTENLQAISNGGARPVLEVAARPSVINLSNNGFGALAAIPNTYVGIQLVWEKFNLGIFPVGGSCHIDVEGENTDAIGIAGSLCSPNSTETARLRDFSSHWAYDLANGTHNAAYYCTNSASLSTCGSKIQDLVNRTLPVAALIPVS
jgi:hypothetical protein